MKYVVIVNGKPGSGKTTFEDMCAEYINENELAHVDIISTIDPIKELYKQLGWDGVTKSNKTRKNLSTLKQMWIDICDGPTKHIVNNIMKADYGEDDVVIFVDIREESEIIKLTNILDALKVIDIRYVTVFIDRKENAGFTYDNKSDDMVGQNMSLYSCKIHNNNSLTALKLRAKDFVNNALLIFDRKEISKNECNNNE